MRNQLEDDAMHATERKPQKTQHTEHSHNNVCEMCCLTAATGENRLIAWCNEFLYITQRIICIAVEDSLNLFRSLVSSLVSLIRGRTTSTTSTEKKENRENSKAPKAADHSHQPGQLCARCMTKKSVPKWMEMLGESLYLGGQVFAYAAMILGGFVFGVAAIISSLFPGGGGAGSHNPAQEAYEAKRKAEDDKTRAAEDDRQRQEEDGYWAAHEKDRQQLNASVIHPIDAGYDASLEDEQRVKELNSSIRAVENGTEAKENLVKMRDELSAHRAKLKRREEERSSKYSAYMKRWHEGQSLLDEAHRADKHGKYREADDLFRRSADAFRDSDRMYAEYLSS